MVDLTLKQLHKKKPPWITLSVNDLKMVIKRQRLLKCIIKKKSPTFYKQFTLSIRI